MVDVTIGILVIKMIEGLINMEIVDIKEMIKSLVKGIIIGGMIMIEIEVEVVGIKMIINIEKIGLV